MRSNYSYILSTEGTLIDVFLLLIKGAPTSLYFIVNYIDPNFSMSKKEITKKIPSNSLFQF